MLTQVLQHVQHETTNNEVIIANNNSIRVAGVGKITMDIRILKRVM